MYRFSDIYGHEDIIKSLKKSLDAKSYSHAYIFDGIMGVGKKTLVGIFAKALQCSDLARPCNECISCRAFDVGNHPDIIYVVPSGRALGVDDIREQVGNVVHIRPYKYEHKIFIIHGAEQMSHAAQNALLKTLEEPPSYAVFLLVSENFNNFLPTILSRCVTLKLKPISHELVEKYLKEQGHAVSEARTSAIASGGSIGEAKILIADETFKDHQKEIRDILNSLLGASLWDILLLAKRLEKLKDHSTRSLNFIQMWYRDALIYKATGSAERFMQKELEKSVIAFCERMSFRELMAGMDAAHDAGYNLSANSNYLLTMEVMLMKMAGR
jgi:DNA polymerase-3 subunit delta'